MSWSPEAAYCAADCRGDNSRSRRAHLTNAPSVDRVISHQAPTRGPTATLSGYFFESWCKRPPQRISLPPSDQLSTFLIIVKVNGSNKARVSPSSLTAEGAKRGRTPKGRALERSDSSCLFPRPTRTRNAVVSDGLDSLLAQPVRFSGDRTLCAGPGVHLRSGSSDERVAD
jgi:hypothetical protein